MPRKSDAQKQQEEELEFINKLLVIYKRNGLTRERLTEIGYELQKRVQVLTPEPIKEEEE